MKTLRVIQKKNPRVNFELLQESLKLSKRLSKSGVGPGKSYSLPSPYQTRLVRTTPAELLALMESD